MRENAYTVGQLISYLKENFKPDDKVCYMDCVEGLKNDCTYVTKDMLGDRLFKYVGDDNYEYVSKNDVIVI